MSTASGTSALDLMPNSSMASSSVFLTEFDQKDPFVHPPQASTLSHSASHASILSRSAQHMLLNDSQMPPSLSFSASTSHLSNHHITSASSSSKGRSKSTNSKPYVAPARFKSLRPSFSEQLAAATSKAQEALVYVIQTFG
jgi:hypothetical protein